MPIIKSITDIGYRIKRDIPSISKKPMVMVSSDLNTKIKEEINTKYIYENMNNSIEEFNKLQYIEPNRNNQDIPKDVLSMIKDNINSIIDKDFLLKYVIKNVNDNEIPKFKLEMVKPDMNPDKESGFGIEMVKPDMNPDKESGFADKESGFGIEMVKPDMNPDKESGFGLKNILPNLQTPFTGNNSMKMVRFNEQGEFISDYTTKNIENHTGENSWKNYNEYNGKVMIDRNAPNSLLDMSKKTLEENIENVWSNITNIGDQLKEAFIQKQNELIQKGTQLANTTIADLEQALIKDPMDWATGIINDPKKLWAKETYTDIPKNISSSINDLNSDMIDKTNSIFNELGIPITIQMKHPQLAQVMAAVQELKRVKNNEAEEEEEKEPTRLQDASSKYIKNDKVQEIMAQGDTKVNEAEKSLKQDMKDTITRVETSPAGNIPAVKTATNNIKKKFGLEDKPKEKDNSVLNRFGETIKQQKLTQRGTDPIVISSTTENLLAYITDTELSTGHTPIILDNNGDPIKDTRPAGKVAFHFNGYKEGPFRDVMQNIFQGIVGFQGVPDIFVDIEIVPHEYKLSSDNSFTKDSVIDRGEVIYKPPKYPSELLGGYMLADFEVRDIHMTTEENWDLGVYGTSPTSISMILPSNLSISFVEDANLLTSKWFMAYMQYMFGAKLDLHAMRPYKMCCQDITLYTQTFYGECLYARTYIAYPLFNFSSRMLGTGSVRVKDTEWIIVGMMEYDQKEELAPLEPNITRNSGFADHNTKVLGGNNVTAKDDVAGFLLNDAAKDGLLDSEVLERAQALGLSGGVFTNLTGLDGIIKKVLADKTKKYLVCSYCNFVQNPSINQLMADNEGYSAEDFSYDKVLDTTQFKWDRASGPINAGYERLIRNDILAADRAIQYVKEFVAFGVPEDNIKVILGSQDGIPGFKGDDFLSKINSSKPVIDGGYFLGGILQYEDNDHILNNVSSSVSASEKFDKGASANRRTDMFTMKDLLEIEEFKNLYSITGNSEEDELALWEKLPKIQFGRQISQNSNGFKMSNYTTKTRIESSSTSNFSKEPGISSDYALNWRDNTSCGLNTFYPDYNTSKEKTTQKVNVMARAKFMTNDNNNKIQANPTILPSLNKEKKIEEAEQIIFDVSQKIDANIQTQEDIKNYSIALIKKEQFKKTTKNLTEEIMFNKSYQLNLLSVFSNVSNQSPTWWRKTFGSNKYKIDNFEETSLENIQTSSYSLQFPRDINSKDILYPCLKLKVLSMDNLTEDSNRLYLVNTFFKNNSLCWIYNIYYDTLSFYQKINI